MRKSKSQDTVLLAVVEVRHDGSEITRIAAIEMKKYIICIYEYRKYII